MEINVKHGDELVIALSGRLDTITSTELLDAFSKEEVKEDVLVVDMKDLEYISSAGLRALLSMKKELADKGKKIEVHNLNAVCSEVFRVTGMSNLLTVN